MAMLREIQSLPSFWKSLHLIGGHKTMRACRTATSTDLQVFQEQQEGNVQLLEMETSMRVSSGSIRVTITPAWLKLTKVM